ncbi:MAG: four helix bundle protein [Agathobaculum butyriciproducens]|jgi:four helix bundle protein|nr:four helix bundle protein [Butyricicoccus sp. BIOML-A1]MEE0153837.1 four helix bundle protein [Agathobaculum butyriciproducens]MZT27488.1 four helix bundle protein [Butyricicoccus sp. BIOML-A1]
MEQDRVLQRKSLTYAKRIIGLYQNLQKRDCPYVLLKQILRSGTSIGANIAEARFASSRKDFLNKLYIALKECSETQYWLQLLSESGFLTATEYSSMQADADELLKLLVAITKTIKAQ